MNKKVYQAVMSGRSDNNIRFKDLRNLLKDCGFTERIKGGHYIFKMENFPERINIQPLGNKAKPYQVQQMRMIFEKYGI